MKTIALFTLSFERRPEQIYDTILDLEKKFFIRNV